MKDIDVRRALYRKVLDEHQSQVDTIVLDELGLCQGAARVDVAVVNGRIHGFEIKSQADTLGRLPQQAEVYCATLDQVTLVLHESHLDEAKALVPDWWGLKVATSGRRGAVHFHQHRVAKLNPHPDPVAIAGLLWAEEALAILTRHGMDRGVRSKPRKELYARLAERLPLETLRDEVRAALKQRHAWVKNHVFTNLSGLVAQQPA
jgi:hypothetical protein